MDIFIQRNGKCPSSSCLAILLNVGVISDWISISAIFDIDISDIGRCQNSYIGTPLVEVQENVFHLCMHVRSYPAAILYLSKHMQYTMLGGE